MPTTSQNSSSGKESPSATASSPIAPAPGASLVEPLGFSVVTVGMLTPLGVIPVVMLQKAPNVTVGDFNPPNRIAA